MKRTYILISLMVLSFAATAWTQVTTRTVTGTRIGHYRDGAVPVDLSIRPVEAFVPGISGGYREIVGTGTSAGTFTIPDVPYGYYLLRVGGRYLWTKNTNVDADYDSFLRSTEVLASPDTTITFNLKNLSSWGTNDVLEFVDLNTGGFQLFTGTEGETKFAGTYPYTSYLADASQGDVTYLLQLATQEVGGFPFNAVARYLPLSLTQLDGADTSIAGWMLPVAQTQTFRANVMGSDIAAQALAANPGTSLVSTAIALDPYPGNINRGWTVSTPDLVGYDLNADAPFLTLNADLGDVMYGNPFPARYPLFVLYQYQGQTSYLAPGATQSGVVTTYAAGYTTAMPTMTSPIAPMVGTVTNPKISGGDFFTNRSGIGFSPSLSWTAPNVGTATLYTVRVWDLIVDAGVTVPTLVANMQTSAMSIKIPANIMLAGQTYVFQITADYRPNVNVTLRPFQLGPTHATADVLSGMMQP